jgi:hypothetical protein
LMLVHTRRDVAPSGWPKWLDEPQPFALPPGYL